MKKIVLMSLGALLLAGCVKNGSNDWGSGNTTAEKQKKADPDDLN